MGAGVCPRRYCALPLRSGTDGNGRAVVVCDGCARNAAGLCRDCPAPVSGLAMRCQRCATRRTDQRRADRYVTRHADILEQKRRYRTQPDVVARARAYGARYRADHPTRRDDLDRLYHREWSRRNYHAKKAASTGVVQ